MPLLIVASGLHLSTASVTCQQAPSSVAQSSSQSQLKTSVINRSVQPQLELLRVTTVAFTVSCLTKQPTGCGLPASSFRFDQTQCFTVKDHALTTHGLNRGKQIWLMSAGTRSKLRRKMATACNLASMVLNQSVQGSMHAGITPDAVALWGLSSSLWYP